VKTTCGKKLDKIPIIYNRTKNIYSRSVWLFQFHTHVSDWTSFHEQVPKEVLPTEYGGEAGSVQENWGESGRTSTYKALNMEKTLQQNITNGALNLN